MFQLFSHLHVAESASEIIWKINQRYFFTPIRHDYLASTVPIVTIRRLCGLPVVLASVGRVMRIGRWSQPRWEVTVEPVVLFHVTISPSKLFMSEVLMLMVS